MPQSGSDGAAPVITDGEMGTLNLRTVQKGMTERAGPTTPTDYANHQSRNHLDTNVMKRRVINQKNKSSFPNVPKISRPSVSQNQNRSNYRKNFDRPTASSKTGQSGIPKNLEIKYRKDMQQLKFYQTLNNYQNIIK